MCCRVFLCVLLLIKEKMLKRYFVLVSFFSIILAGCASVPSAQVKPSNEPFLSSLPAQGELVFIGAIGKHSNPKETVQLALEDAARRVAAFYYQVSGGYSSETTIGSGAFDYTHEIKTELSAGEESAGQYVGQLKFNSDTDALEIEGTFIIRTTYTASLPAPVSYHPVYSGEDKRPDWVDAQPIKIGDYIIGVGTAGRHSSLSDAISASYKNAIFSIIRNITVDSGGSALLYQGTGFLDYKTENQSSISASGKLNNFYVLDTWINPKDKNVWTLAIAIPAN
jgi:hypothetical protein